MKHLLKKFDYIIVFFIFGISISFYCFNFAINYGDELWNFQNIYKMYNGFYIYKDCNVIITPLFFIIGELFFKLLYPNIFTFRIYNLIIFSIFYTVIYALLKMLLSSHLKSMFFTSIIFAFSYDVASGGANYNILAMLFVILGTIFLIKSREKFLYLILSGFTIYLVLFTKQSIGVYYLFGIFVAEFFINKNLFLTLKRLSIQLSFTIFSILISLFIMYKYNILYEFINYAILGMKEFSIRNIILPSIDIIISFLLISIVYVFVLYIIKFKKNLLNNNISNLILIICISFFINLTLYPIFNLYHAKIVLVLVISLFIYIIDLLVLTPLLDIKLYKKLCIVISSVIVSVIFIYSVTLHLINLHYFKYYDISHPYFYCYIPDESKNKINNITEYIKKENSKGIDVIIASDRAALYMIPLKQSHGYFDLPFLGNLGKYGEDGVIEKIKSLKNTQILIVSDDEDVFYQESQKVRDYIINNLNLVDTIEEFSIYETN